MHIYYSQPRGLLALKCGSGGLKTAKMTVNRRFLSWRYLAKFETVLRTSSRFLRFSPNFFANSSEKLVGMVTLGATFLS